MVCHQSGRMFAESLVNSDGIDSDYDKLVKCYNDWTEGKYVLFDEDVYNSQLLSATYEAICYEKNKLLLVQKLKKIWLENYPSLDCNNDFLSLANIIITQIHLNLNDDK